MILLATILLLLCIPEAAIAWGPGFHLQLGSSVLANLSVLPATVAGVIGAFPNDFLYGSIAADITVGKKYTAYLQHCHRWPVARTLLARSETGAQQACAYGYISHLAADIISHCYYVPYSIMLSYQTVMLNHAYWEVRFDSQTPPEIWAVGRRVAMEHFQENDALLRREIANTIFSFGTNKKIFNSILLVSKLEKWQQLISTMHDISRFQLRDEETSEYAALAEQAVMETLSDVAGSRWKIADPTGEQALAVAGAIRKNLRILYRSGRISKESAGGELARIKGCLADAILRPELLQQIISTS